MTPSVHIDDLKVGMFIHLDLGWWAHPFALSSFLLTSDEQIATIRRLGLQRLRWSPDKSRLPEAEPPASPPAAIPESADTAIAQGAGAVTADAADSPARRAAAPAGADPGANRARLAAQRQAERQCRAQVAEARLAWLQASLCLASAPQQARQIAAGLAQAITDKLLAPDELCVRVLAEDAGDAQAPQARHALNVMLVAMMLGRQLALDATALHGLGLAALLHDIGKTTLPASQRHPPASGQGPDMQAYRSHVALGLALGRRMGLDEPVLQLIGQHHELADGSGFPAGLTLAQMAPGARILALVNRYDTLCHPPPPAPGLTPHEAVAALFSQSQRAFDADVLQRFVRMIGVYPPGTVVQLSDERYASVVSVNPARPLKPRVLVAALDTPRDEALLLDLAGQPELGIRRSLRPDRLPAAVRAYLDPAPRMVYTFEPAEPVRADSHPALAA